MYPGRCLVLTMFAAALVPLATAGAQLGIMVPAYFSPSSGGYWSALDAAAVRVPLVAIMNPANGPGSFQQPAYVQALASLHQAGGKISGYVHTSYGARPLAEVETDIDLYLAFYAVDGFLVDEMTNDADTNHLNYYATLYLYIKSKGANYSVTGNPGSNTQETYLSRPTADTLLIFENNGTNYGGFTPSGWTAKYPGAQFMQLPYAVAGAEAMSNYLGLAVSRNAGWIYVTDDTLSNPYDTLPSYWTNEVGLVESFNGGKLPVSILTQPADQKAAPGGAVRLSVTAFGSPPLAYQWFGGANPIPDATNATYLISSVQLTNAGSYYVQISNAINAINSRTAWLRVHPTISCYQGIQIDGSFNDWAGVPLAYTAPAGPTSAIQYKDVYIANDQTNLYIRFSLYSPRPNAFANSYDNLCIDADADATTGFPVAGIGSDMLVQWGSGYQQKNGGWNEGKVSHLGWAIAGSPDSIDFELAIARGAAYVSDGSPVFANNTISILLEGDDTNFHGVEFVPLLGGLSYTLAPKPNTPGPLFISGSGGQAILSWPGSGILQSCGALAQGATWTNVPEAASPYVFPVSAAQLYFRLAQ